VPFERPGKKNQQRYGSGEGAEFYRAIDAERYRLDWMMPEFAGFDRYAGKQVLEVGLGTGLDFIRWVRAGAVAHGRDLTAASIAHMQARLSFEPCHCFADARQGDAEALDLPDDSMDLYYSWGCLHHTPDTEKAIVEAYRVLKPGGELKILIYHRRSVCALLVWLTRGYGAERGCSEASPIISNLQGRRRTRAPRPRGSCGNFKTSRSGRG